MPADRIPAPKRCRRRWTGRTSSLSGFCPRARFRRMAPATCANDRPLRTAGDRYEPLGSDGMGPNVDQALAHWQGGPIPSGRGRPSALGPPRPGTRSASQARQGRFPAQGWELAGLALTRSRSDTEVSDAGRDGEEPMRVEQRLEELGLVLPGPPEVPSGFKFPFSWVRVWDGKAYVSGHSAQAPDGSFTGPFGKVPIEVSLEAAQQAADRTALSILGSLKRALGDLDRVTGLADGIWHGQRRSRLFTNDPRHQWLLGPDR